MSVLYLQENLEDLLKYKYVLLLGDSVQRSVYKDLVVLSHQNRLIDEWELRRKGEERFLNDKLLFRSELTNGTHYREEREYKSDKFHFKFHFLTRIYNDYVESILKDIEQDITACPDVLIINSCLWDISRYGDDSMVEYRKNIEKLCTRLIEILPYDTLVIWTTALPVSKTIKGGFLTPEARNGRNDLRKDILKANCLAFEIVKRFDLDVLDMHYHFQYQLQRRASDGVHWNTYAHRQITNLILRRISQSWGEELPRANKPRKDFPTYDVSMYNTNIPQQAYPPLMDSPPNFGWGRPLSQEPYFQDDYSNMYPVPYEEDYVLPDDSDNDMYHFLPPEPILDRSYELSTSPYPPPQQGMYPPNNQRNPSLKSNSNLGPMRIIKRRRYRKNYAQSRGTLTERVKMRTKVERNQKNINHYSAHTSDNFPERYFQSPPAMRKPWNRPARRNIPHYNMNSVENYWSQFPHPQPQYNSYDDRFHEDT